MVLTKRTLPDSTVLASWRIADIWYSYRRILDGICKRRPQERYQAIKLLYWITCAFRPMRIHELRDGIAFRKEQVTPDQRNRLQRNIVELCGPIIEELPGDIVDTVHFSAKEWGPAFHASESTS